jgi:hypothetical protein
MYPLSPETDQWDQVMSGRLPPLGRIGRTAYSYEASAAKLGERLDPFGGDI